MTNRIQTKGLLKSHHLAPHKKLGQNFLVDGSVITSILDASSISSTDTIIEVGVGLGALTVPLAARVQKVIGFEIDAGLVALHQKEGDLPENTQLRHQDILQCDLRLLSEEIGTKLKIIANLPYSISNPFLFQLIDSAPYIDSAVIMLQKEVGDRLVAQPQTKQYGVLSVLMGTVARVQKILTLGPQHFHPPPKVDSVVIHIQFDPTITGQLPPHDPALLKLLIKTAFQQRRKTILNALSAAPGGDEKDGVRRKIKGAGIESNRRPDTLHLTEYIALSQAWTL